MALLGTLIVGLIVGALARLFMPGRDAMGIIFTMLLGIAGAFLGSWLGQVIGLYMPGEPAGMIMAIIGAMLILWITRIFSPRTA